MKVMMTQTKEVIQFDAEGNEINRFISTRQASEMTGISVDQIRLQCMGRKCNIKGCSFAYSGNLLAVANRRRKKNETINNDAEGRDNKEA